MYEECETSIPTSKWNKSKKANISKTSCFFMYFMCKASSSFNVLLFSWIFSLTWCKKFHNNNISAPKQHAVGYMLWPKLPFQLKIFFQARHLILLFHHFTIGSFRSQFCGFFFPFQQWQLLQHIGFCFIFDTLMEQDKKTKGMYNNENYQTYSNSKVPPNYLFLSLLI